jgi:ribosomal protein L11 methylase PrmA
MWQVHEKRVWMAVLVVSVSNFVTISNSFPSFLPSHQRRRQRILSPIPKQLFSLSHDYTWELQHGNGDVVSDLLLELGALSSQVVLSHLGAAEDASPDDFDRTGRHRTHSNMVIFSAPDDASAQRLVEGVSDILDLDATDAWQASCRKQDPAQISSETTPGEEIATGGPQPETNFTIDVGGRTIVLTTTRWNTDETCWAFGDGNHPSTRVIMAGLESYVSPGNSVLDFGCGSGILSLVARALGASHVTSVDISTDALDLTRYNMLQNNFEADTTHAANENHEILHSEKYRPRKFDIVVANIPANTLKGLLPILADSMDDHGVMLLSGYPSTEAELVETAAKNYDMEVCGRKYDSGWILQVLSPKGKKMSKDVCLS